MALDRWQIRREYLDGRAPSVMTPDDIFAGVDLQQGPVVVYDDDHYYIGGVIAEKLRGEGLDVTLVTPANEVSTWTTHTEEQHRIQQRILLNLGITIVETGTSLAEILPGAPSLRSGVFTGTSRASSLASTVVMATSRDSPGRSLLRFSARTRSRSRESVTVLRRGPSRHRRVLWP